MVATIGQQPCGLGEFIKQGGWAGVIANRTCRHEKIERATIHIGYGLELVLMPSFVRPIRRPPFLPLGWKP
jgi:hypothetical protein